MAKTKQDAPVTVSAYSKAQILKSQKYHTHRDILAAVLKDKRSYTHKEVEEAIEAFMKGKVK